MEPIEVSDDDTLVVSLEVYRNALGEQYGIINMEGGEPEYLSIPEAMLQQLPMAIAYIKSMQQPT